MKQTHPPCDEGGSGLTGAVKRRCAASCQTIRAQITTAKAAIFAEAFKLLNAQERLLRLVLTEAEAVSWETQYPHLVFPVLATEKVQAVLAWDQQQRRVQHRNPTLSPKTR